MTEVTLDAPATPPPGKAQPIGAIAANTDPVFDDNAVREAIRQAEANDQDPMTIRVNELPPQGQGVKVEVPQKFLKPDGAVDVEKLQASTRQLDEAIQKKEAAIQKANLTVDDLVKENLELEKKFRTLPNAEKLTASLPAAAPLPEANTTPQNFEEVVRRDFQADPLGTMIRLNQALLDKELQPIREEKRMETTRNNLKTLAEKDPRILQPELYEAVKQKLQSDPDLWKLKNPHKAAWLEVKEEMRLGEPAGAQAQPSRASPILGGGTPPSAPSSSVPNTQDVLSSLHTLDLRKKDQEDLGDAAIRSLLAGMR